jgi:hypothetical protein
MKITEEQFKEAMELRDEYAENMVHYSGLINAIYDGEDVEASEDELSNMIDEREKDLIDLAKELELSYYQLIDGFDSCITNRWELYNLLKGGK